MPRQETILSVFVASPSDVDEERNCIEEVIRDLNTAWARELRIRLELVRWETHAFPSFGEDPQAIINEQIPDDFDLFVGLMWCRFGTPTGRAGSGTAEEFERAKARFDKSPNDLQLMIYFKDAPAPVAPSKLDHGQLAKVSEFRSSLGNEGGLYWTFQTIDEFEKVIRLHLTRHVHSWLAQSRKTASDAIETSVEPNDDTNVSKDMSSVPFDDGLLDLIEQFEVEFETLTEIIERIADATIEIGEKINERTAETNEFAVGPNAKDRKAAKKIIARVVTDMDQYVHRIESELPLFSQHLNAGMNAMIKAAEMSVEFKLDEAGLQQAKESLVATAGFRETMSTVEGKISEFQESIASLPRMTSVLNQSKKAMVKVLGRLVAEFQTAQTLAREAEASFNSIV